MKVIVEDKREPPYGPLLKLEKVQGVAARVVRGLEQASRLCILGGRRCLLHSCTGSWSDQERLLSGAAVALSVYLRIRL